MGHQNVGIKGQVADAIRRLTEGQGVDKSVNVGQETPLCCYCQGINTNIPVGAL